MSLSNIKKLLDKISSLENLSEKEVELLNTPQNILKASLEVNGKNYPAYRVQFNNARGPFKGGIRFHPEVDLDEVSSLSFWMSLKTAVVDLPLGGGKGGVTVNPKELSIEEIEELSRAYVRAFHANLGSDKDIPAPDVYTTPQIMVWMLDEFEKITGKKDPGMITGKPIENGGSYVRDIATALGGVYVLEEAIKKVDVEKRVAIQGFGNAGMTAAKLLHERGFSIVAVSDSKGGIYNENGLNLISVIDAKKNQGSVSKYVASGASVITNRELLALDCDILVPSALGEVITRSNVSDVKAKIILELANGPTTPEADEILFSKGVMVIPDILANAGGVTVSCFEWQQNVANERWEEEDIKRKLHSKMVAAFENVWTTEYDLRTSSYRYAIKSILEAERKRGRL